MTIGLRNVVSIVEHSAHLFSGVEVVFWYRASSFVPNVSQRMLFFLLCKVLRFFAILLQCKMARSEPEAKQLEGQLLSR